MTTLRAEDVCIPESVLTSILEGKERVWVEQAGKPIAAMVSIEDLKLLELYEDLLDSQEAERALKEFEESGEPSVPYEVIRRELGLE